MASLVNANRAYVNKSQKKSLSMILKKAILKSLDTSIQMKCMRLIHFQIFLTQ